MAILPFTFSSAFAQSLSDEEYQEQLSESLVKDTVLNIIIHHELSFVDETAKRFDALQILSEIAHLESVYYDSKYYPLQLDWEKTKRDLRIISTVDELFRYQNMISQIYDAAKLVESAEIISDEFADSDDLSQLKILLKPKWSPVQSGISNANSADDINKLKSSIVGTQEIFDIAKQLYTKNDFLHANKIIDSTAPFLWSSLLGHIHDSATILDARNVISNYEKKFSQKEDVLLEKSKIKYLNLLEQSKNLQLDDETKQINKMLDNLRITKSFKQNTNPFSHSDDEITNSILYKSGMLLNKIDSKIKFYNSQEYQQQKKEHEQKTKRIEQIIDSSISSNKMPKFNTMLYDIKDRLAYSKNLNTNQFEKSQQLTDALFLELENLYREYKYEKDYSPLYKSPELSTDDKKELYLDLLDDIAKLVRVFDNDRFDSHRDEFSTRVLDAKNSVEYGNFAAGHENIYDLVLFVEQNLFEHDPRIIFDVKYDDSQNLWHVDGAVYKHSFNYRGNTVFSLYQADGKKINELGFLNTRQGIFDIIWRYPAEPGLYVAEIKHGNSIEYHLVSIQDENGTQLNQKELQMMNLANQFEKLEDFVNLFGGKNYEKNNSKFLPTLQLIQDKLKQNQSYKTQEDIDELQKIIQRYLPVRSEYSVVDAESKNNLLVVSGQVQKLVDFREDLFVTVFDENGNKIYETVTRDDGDGYFDLEFFNPVRSGLVLVQLEYHDSVATDILSIS